jgi:predicted transcriptional regulator YdeE
MAIKVVKTYKENLPAVRFVGKMYTDEDREKDNPKGGFDKYWSEWDKNGWMDNLRELPQIENIDNSPIGLMGIEYKDGVHCNFQYWIGMMLPIETNVPDGFSFVDIPESDVMICWVYGSNETGEIFDCHELCMEKMFGGNWNLIRNDLKGKDKNWCWWFERYNSKRISDEDEKGNVILDYGMYVKTE